jgi:hypothetical protein
MFLVGLASLTAFPAPNPKFCSYCPTLLALDFFSAGSFLLYSSGLSARGKALLA